MDQSFLYRTPVFVICLALFVLMLVMNWIGFKIHQYHARKNPDLISEGIGAIEGSLLGLLALLLSFTFGMSASRYDDRRQTIISEANDIGTAILRCDLYPDSIRQSLRNDFKHYIDARIAFGNAGIDMEKVSSAQKQSMNYQNNIWKTITNASQEKELLFPSQQMIPATNAMIDSVTTREEALNKTVPESIVWLLFLLILTASLVVGYSNNNKKINSIVVSGFALMTALTVFLILDLDRPRRGLINTDSATQKVIELKKLLK